MTALPVIPGVLQVDHVRLIRKYLVEIDFITLPGENEVKAGVLKVREAIADPGH